MSIRDIRRPGAPRTCSKTGFALVPSAGREVYRLSKPSYGPLNPLLRGVSSSESRDAWNRYDVAGQRTVYAASTEQGAYGELLAPLKPKLPASAAIYFDDVASDDDLESLIREEWQSAGHRAPREVDLMWLSEYRLYRLTLPARGWFIDIEAATSLSAITRYAPPSLIERGIREVSVAELRGSDRELTTAIATSVWPLTLDDTSLAHGIMYGSRHGSDWNCWAVWLRRTKRDRAARGLITTADRGIEVLQPALNPALDAILTTYGLIGTW
ncbi:RES domain-containing protein [Nocardia transvalensis]|uniref:RES domain-containing protein n=1 Tax=Nocardia transvalensis TaxID=37333 RepID=UPI001894CEA4|nr:RES domain-containing protein [Nocardia transvalensis]MBF6330460.1 RES domain-containing protein [Nocardia transvalensis]